MTVPMVAARFRINTPRVSDMASVITDLRSKHSELTYAVMRNTASNAFAFVLAAPIAYVFGKMGIQPDISNGSLQSALSVTSQAIDVLSGYTASEAYGNLYDRATTDDAVFKVWADLAQSTGDTIQRARGYAGYDVTDYLSDAGDRLADAGSDAGEVSGNLAMIAAAVVILVLIVRFR